MRTITIIILSLLLSHSVDAQTSVADSTAREPREVYALMPWRWGMSSWRMHEGLNLQLDLGAAIGFGKNNPLRNGAFFTDISAIYAKQLTDRLAVAGGVTVSELTYGGRALYSGSAEAALSYRLTDRLTASVYGAFTYQPDQQGSYPYECGGFGYGGYGYGAMGLGSYGYAASAGLYGGYPFHPYGSYATFGGAIDYKVTENFHVGVSIQCDVPCKGTIPQPDRKGPPAR